jgi:hypothetical protein
LKDDHMVTKLWGLLRSPALATEVAPVLQVAADGQWERARIVPLHGDVEAAREAVAQAAAGARFLAMEIMWPGVMFVGTGWPADRRAEAETAATRAFAAFGDAGRPEALSPAMTGLTALLDGAPDGEVESADLGAVNAWLSVGPEALWRRGESYSATAVESSLANRPNLVTCTHPVAVEFSIPGARPCWVAIVVSAPSDGAHHLDRQRLDDILAEVTNVAGEEKPSPAS